MSEEYRGADLPVRCLEAADFRFIFGVPGEENLDPVDASLERQMRIITTRHEQAAAFMADVYGRLTGNR